MSINFSIPNTPSLTKTTPDSTQTIFVPDIKYLLKFSQGDLGIADAIRTNTIMNTVTRSKSPTVATTYLKSAGGVVSSPDKYVKNGKISIPQSALSLDPSKNQAGLKALEKSIIQSIFDSQKPYMDMFSQLSNVLISVEDIIARVLCLADKSLKPATNPRALGYKKNGKVVTKDSLAQLDSLRQNTPDVNNTNSGTNISNNNSIPNNEHWEVESIVYSTGVFNPNVNYTYEYIDEVQVNPVITGTTSEPNTTNLPQTLIIAVFDNNGNLITDDVINNGSDNLSWIKNSGKWFGSFNYLSSNDNDNLTLFTQYYNDYAVENAPSDLSASDKKNLTDQVNTYVTSNNYQDVREQITNLKSNCFFSTVKFTNTNLLNTINNSGVTQQISFKQAFAPKKLNINGNDIWINPESDYDLKLIRCDSVSKYNDNDITNINPYSTDIYGVDDNDQEQIGQIYRNQNSDTSNDEILDRFGSVLYHKTYFVLEGIVTTNNNQSYDVVNSGSSNTNSNFSYYRKKDFFSAIKRFIDLIILIASKLTPAISAISKIGTNPIAFVTNIMLSNLGDNNGTKDIKFSFFSTEFIKKFSSLKGAPNKSDIIKNSILKNFVLLKKDGTYKFLLSGAGFSLLNNIKIGFSMGQNMTTATASSVYPVTPTPNNLSNSNLSSTVNYSTLKFQSYNSSETIDYIGGYDPSKTYTYIYVTEYELGILQDAQNLENSGDLNGALDKYNEAQKLDPANKTITDKIDALKKLIASFGGNSLFGFILNMITMPLQIVLGIIEQIITIIKKFTSPKTLQSAISDLVAFKIFPGGLSPTDFFTPTNVLKVAKISFNINLFTSWIASLATNPLSTYDLNKIIQVPFVSSFPKYNAKQFKSLVLGHGNGPVNMLPLKMLTGILKIFEGIINAIISFFWALMGIGGLIKQPILKFTKDSNSDISASDIQALLNGTYTDIIDPNSPDAPNYNFIYNVQLPDGRTLRQLDKTELEEFIKEHSNFTYQYKI